MQQRGVVSTTTSTSTGTSMESEDSIDLEDASSLQQQQTRSRHSNNTKLKVLVRSHAMREATSPPRDPQSPPAAATASSPPASPQAASSPCIKLTPSADSQPASPTRALLVLSPTVSSTSTSTLVPSPSPTHLAVLEQADFADHHHQVYVEREASRMVSKLNKQNSARRKNHHHHLDNELDMYEKRGKCDCLNNNNNNHNNNNNTLTVSTRCGNGAVISIRGKLRQQSSSLGSYDGSTPSLSRDNSSEQYTDTTGVDLEQFIPETLNRNSKDRNLMLRIEEELVQLAKDKAKTHFKFPPMSSYQRMLVHRCAAYFGMDHNIESSGKCVVVSKTKSTRIPDVEFKQHIKEEYTEEPRRSILKRDNSSNLDDYGFKSPDRQFSLESRRSKSFEEREEEYEKVRRRIFNKSHDCSSDELGWSEEFSWSNNDGDTKYRLHTDHHHHHNRSSRLLKVQSEDQGEETMRPYVAKSYSFGGYGGTFTRGDSMMSTHSAGPRLFTKQDSAASSVSWRLSPSSSGYKTQSQRSESITPSPTSTPFFSSNDSSSNRQDSTATNASDLPVHNDDDNQQVVWAVTNIHSVPKGSVIINPQTGQPIKNHDGSLYHHDPDNPLPELDMKSALHSGNPTHTPSSSMEVANDDAPQNAQPPPNVSAKPPVSPTKASKSPKKPPVKKMNSATSPSLPFTPPPLALPNLSVMPPPLPVAPPAKGYAAGFSDNQQTALMPSQYFGAPPAAAYEYPPCIVYASPYGQMPVGYDARMDAQMQEVPQTTYYVENPPMTYQPPAAANVWPPTQYIYSNGAPRYAAPPGGVPMQQSGAFIAGPYPPPSGYLPPPPQSQATPGAPPGSEMIPVYPQQSLVYPAPPAPTPTMYPNQGVIYAPNGPLPYAANTAVYPPPPPHNLAYPVNPGTPNGAVYHNHQVEQVVQGMAQMHVQSPERRLSTPKCRPGGRAASSQSSTENSSPATAVMAYGGAGVFHRQNSETPPSLPPTPGFGPAFPPIFLRQMSNVRASSPMQARTSRSPTPTMAPPPFGDILLGEPSLRYPLPSLIYHAIPQYTVSTGDARAVSGRGQPPAFRQPSPRHHHHHHHHQQLHAHHPNLQHHHHSHHQPPYHYNSNSNSGTHAFTMAPLPPGPQQQVFRNKKHRSKPTNAGQQFPKDNKKQ